MFNRLNNFFNSFFQLEDKKTQEAHNYKQFLKISRVYFLKITLFLASFITFFIFIFQLINYEKNIINIYLTVVCFLLFLLLFIILYIFKNIDTISSILLFIASITIFFGMIYGGFKKSTIFFSFCFPIVAFFIYGSKKGLIWCINFLLLFIVVIVMNKLNIARSAYNTNESIAAFSALCSLVILTFFYAYRQEKIEIKVSKQIYYDSLTGLPNRKKLIMDLEERNNIVLCIINVDDFKEINNLFGFAIGDAALIFLKEKILETLTSEKLYKLNGDEFAIVAESTDEEIDHIKSLINSINNDLQIKKFSYKDDQIILRVSAGIADKYKYQDENIFSLADIALKEAKKLSLAVVEYSPELLKRKDDYLDHIVSLNIISDAIENDRIFPYYQPILNNKTGKIEKFECLVRIANSNGEILAPLRFLDIAKKSRLYPKITRIMLKKAVERFKGTNYEFSINLAVEDFLNPYTLQFIMIVLEENRQICPNINFEIIETEGIHSYFLFSRFIKTIKDFGCKIAIDDFGSGYSNFDHFVKLNVDYLKIDGSLIKNIDNDKNSKIIVSNIVKFANELSLKTVAEYVHSKDVFNTVKDLGIDYSQGYYIGYPSPQIIEEVN